MPDRFLSLSYDLLTNKERILYNALDSIDDFLHISISNRLKRIHDFLDTLQDFLKEAQTIARLIHPNIVRVHEFGIEGGTTPFLVMDYAPNGTLRQNPGIVLSATDVVTYVKQIASALYYVHNEQLIHRDIKPENLLNGRNNEVLLSDFGIAVAAQYQNRQLVIGTVDYMSPEQISGRPIPASDQYSLAVVVYEWLSGNCPFSGSTSREIALQHLNTNPPSLCMKTPTILPGVDQVVLKALAKDPGQRYATILDFADALEKACVSAQSNVIVSPSVPTMTVMPTPAQQGPTKITLPPTKYPLPTKVLPTLPAIPTLAPGTCLYTYQGHTDFVRTVAWSPNGIRVASGSDDWTVQVWDALTGDNAFIYRDHRFQIWTVAWSPDGLHIASGTAGQVAHIWNAITGDNTVIYDNHGSDSLNTVYALAWSPDSKLIASAGTDKTVQVWDIAYGRRQLIYRGHSAEVDAVVWSPDGQWVASAGDDKTVQIWKAANGKSNLSYKGHARRICAIACSPDGTRIVSASDDRTAQVWDVITGDRIAFHQHTKRVRTVAWAPDPNLGRIASAGDDRAVHVWDAATGDLLFTGSGHEAGINAVVWSPDGSYIASAGSDGTVKVWQAR